MQDLKKNKRRMNNKQMSTMSNCPEREEVESVVSVEVDEFDRGCKCNNDMESHKNKCNEKHENKCNEKHEKHECECHCECKKHEECKECEVISEECSVNPCREECCNGIRPTFSTKNASPVAIETNRIFDSIQFRAFTDAKGPNGQTLFFEFEVIEVRGNVPSRGLAKVVVDEVCMNFEELEITPG